MKAARIRITTQTLSRVLALPSEAEIVSVFQDSTDRAQFSASIVVRGAGEELAEGGEVKCMSIEEIQE